MNRIAILILSISLMLSIYVTGQNSLNLSGSVSDENGVPLIGAYIEVTNNSLVAVSDRNGYFNLNFSQKGEYILKVSYVGYETISDTIYVNGNVRLGYSMHVSDMCLHEVVVEDHYHSEHSRGQSLSSEFVNDDYLEKNREGSLMKSLERLPGISTIDVGSGQSKPVIRGLGFNRVLVVENGIKHEGQQWGADHGLEIDQYSVDNVEVLKGPASLMYGGDAIGGVINVNQNNVPAQNTIGGEVEFTGKSNNNYLGTSVLVNGRRKTAFGGIRATYVNYADYRVPAESVDIYSYKLPLNNNRLRNTAGQEQNLSVNLGIMKEHFTGKVYVSNIHSKSGFFANAHGKEPRNVDEELHDANDRDIQKPFGEVNHFKVVNKNTWSYARFKLDANAGFQKNFRQEWSDYTPHGDMPRYFPDSLNMDPDLEREFEKYIYSANINAKYSINDKILINSGISFDYQKNYINGIGFVIPQFTQVNAGGYLVSKYEYSERSIFHAGIRYDYGSVNTEEYSDWFRTELIEVADTTYEYLQRGFDLDREFSSISWSLGYNINFEKLEIKANAGKSFRMPIAKELAANGVNYHLFRYEIGDRNLNPEESYQFDLGVEFHTSDFAAGVTPFVNYFTNYIYLNPTPDYDRNYGNGFQKFEYTETEVFRYGGEVHSHYRLFSFLQLGVIGEYVYSEQMEGLKKGYTLPFSPPASVIFNAKYNKSKIWHMHKIYATTDFKLVAAQTDIVPPEEITEGYNVVSIGAGFSVYAGKQIVNLSLQVNNLFDTKYFNHTSFYRIINLPEAGRNIVVGLSIPFKTIISNTNN